jgi:hypothetical protein
MKRIFTILAALLISAMGWAQTPQKMTYQAIIRDATNNLVSNTQVGLQIKILQGSETGAVVYRETQTPTTNVNGLLTVEIGGGLGFDAIDWANDIYFIETNIDPQGGTDYTINGVTQLLAVPYALHAKTAEFVEHEVDGDATNEIQNLSDVLAVNNDGDAKQIKNIADPTEAQDAATKNYVDLLIQSQEKSGIKTANITGNFAKNRNGSSLGFGNGTSASWRIHSHFITFETDPVFTNWDKSTGIIITESQISDLQHFTTSDETDPVFTDWDKSTGISITESQISDLQHFTNADETDPIFTAWDKSYTDLTQKPAIADTVNDILDTTTQFVRTEVDGDITNEIQTISRTGLTVTLSNGGGVYQDSINAYTAGTGIKIKNNVISVTGIIQIDSSYVVEMDKSDKDFVNFGAFANFTNNSSWSVIERVKMPIGTGADGGWHFFRGYAWGDKEGDIAIQIRSDNIYTWLRKGGWQNISYNHSFNEDQWYNICFQYNASTQTLELYVDGELVGQHGGIAPQNDSGNTNNMLWGGQEHSGSLYAEASIIIANQVWLQRVLTPEEIQSYDGHMDADPAIFFSSEINSNSVTDASGNGHDGTNGASPEYFIQTSQSSESNTPLVVNDVNLSNNLKIKSKIDSNSSSSGLTTMGQVDINGTGFGAALFLASDGNYEEADADAVATMPCVALAIETGTGEKEILLQGYIRNDNWNWTIGQTIYVSPTTGLITQVRPSLSGQQVQTIGYAVSANTIYFTPNLMLIEIN